MTRRSLALVPLALLPLLPLGCGPDQELLASALIHRCAMEAALEQAKSATDPQAKAAATKEAMERRELLQSVLQSGNEGKLREALKKEKCPGG